MNIQKLHRVYRYNLLWARFALVKMIEIARRPLQVCLNQLMIFGGGFVRVLRGLSYGYC